ncbi:MAG: carboxypeptidase regulatory-like domain-containing protein [Planctomycetes bacterium]|nr:carboxypeptidase regulatory-like domain-containing protein [Planctomycetota bacterium]MBI3847114.1 carboxypeptidase regulatory-like domain-containing protein [Planctomycetota bacterium]
MKSRSALVVALAAVLVVVAGVWLLRMQSPDERADRTPRPSMQTGETLDHTPRNVAAIPEAKDSTGAYPAVSGGPKNGGAAMRASFVGRLVDEHERTPVAAVRVLLVHPTKETTLLATSDLEGRFRIEDLDAETYRIEIDDDFWVVAGKDSVVATTKPSEAEIDCRLGGLVTGRVVDAAGRAVAGASVAETPVMSIDAMFDSESSGGAMKASGTVLTDAAGRFRLRGIRAARAATVHASHPDFASADSPVVAVRAGEESTVGVIRLLAGGSVSGRVTDSSGAPVPGADAVVKEGSLDLGQMMQMGTRVGEETKTHAKTDADGRYHVTHVIPGDKAVVVAAPGFVTGRKGDIKVEEGHETSGIDVSLVTGAVIGGRVLDFEKSPVPQASIVVDVNPMDFLKTGSFERQSTQSDADGRFRLIDLGPDPVNLSITKQGLRKVQRKGVKPGGDELEIVMGRGACLAGKVVDATTHDGLASFTIKVSRANAMATMMSGTPTEKLNQAFTATDGDFEFCGLEAGTYAIEVTADGYARSKLDKVEVTEDGRTGDLVVEMRTGCVIQGVVLSKADGKPIPGATVTLGEASAMGDFMTVLSAKTDEDLPSSRSIADGSFTLTRVPPGTVNLIAIHRDWPLGTAPGIQATPDAPTTRVEILMPAAARVSGTVFGADGRPEAGSMVMLMKGFMPSRQTSTDAAGRYEITGLVAGDYSLMRVAMKFKVGSGASPGGTESVPVTLHEGEDLVVDIGKRSALVGCRLFGRITSGGEPVHDMMLQLLRDRGAVAGGFNARTASTDSDGRYEILGVEAGKFVLQMIGAQFGQGAYGQSVEIGEDEREKRLDVDLPRGAIVGHVVDAQSQKPIQGIIVWATLESEARKGDEIQLLMSGRVSQGLSDADGRYEVRPIAKGLYRVRAGSFPFELPQFASDYAGEIVDDVEAPEAGEATLDFALEHAATIEGFVREASGEPIASAYVSLFDDHGNNASGPLVPPTGADGKYRITGLREGRYWLRASSSRHALSPRRSASVQKGKTTTEDIVLTPGGSVAVAVRGGGLDVTDATIELVDESGQPVPGLTSIFQLFTDGESDAASEAGVRLFSHVTPGRYTIRARKEGVGEGSMTATVREGATTSVRVMLE